MSFPPFRAVGNRVLLRRLRQDTGRLWLQENSGTREVAQLGEVIGLGARWTADAPWVVPMPRQDRRDVAPMLDGSADVEWKPEQIEELPRVRPEAIGPTELLALEDVKPGDVVVFINARVLDTFKWGDQDILVYPGNWLLGVVSDTWLANRPEARRYADQPL